MSIVSCYVGLDYHDETIRVCVLAEDGELIATSPRPWRVRCQPRADSIARNGIAFAWPNLRILSHADGAQPQRLFHKGEMVK